MKRTRRKKSRIYYFKLVFILFAILFISLIVKNTFAKYTSSATSSSNVDVAFYLFNETTTTQNLQLTDLIPSSTPYIYTISIANNDGTHRTDTAMEYDIQIIATTNLPLTYEIYKNELYTDPDPEDLTLGNEYNEREENLLITENERTYFKIINLPSEQFGFTTDQQNVYQLVITFPDYYNSSLYQNIIENLEITVNSRQRVATNP